MGLANEAVTPGRTSLLEAVNICLSNIGEAPMATLEDTQNLEAATAERTILEFHKEGQSRGWSWNNEDGYRFERDAGTLEITVPPNVVRFVPDRYQWAGRFQLRGQRVYDLQARSFQVEDIEFIEADITTLLPWDECPEAFNRWSLIRASRVFAGRVLTSDSVFQYTMQDEQAALAELERIESDQAQANILTDGYGSRPFGTFNPASGLMGRRSTSVLPRG